jgi:hypothetical protein
MRTTVRCSALLVAWLLGVSCQRQDAAPVARSSTMWSVLGWESDSTLLLARVDLAQTSAASRVDCDSSGVFVASMSGALRRSSSPDVSCSTFVELAGLSKNPSSSHWVAGRAGRADGLAVFTGEHPARSWVPACHDTRDPVWSRGGDSVAFIGNCQIRGGGTALYIVGYPTGEPNLVQMAPKTSLRWSELAWSGDGARFLLVGGYAGPSSMIVLVDRRNAAAPQVVVTGHSPSWHPTGERFAYVATGDDRSSVVRIHDPLSGVDSLLARQSSAEPAGAAGSRVVGVPRWSRDGRVLAFSTGADVVLFELRTGLSRQLLRP